MKFLAYLLCFIFCFSVVAQEAPIAEEAIPEMEQEIIDQEIIDQETVDQETVEEEATEEEATEEEATEEEAIEEEAIEEEAIEEEAIEEEAIEEEAIEEEILDDSAIPTFEKEYADDPVICIETNMGKIYIELFAKEAPETVKNFIDLAEGKKEFTDIQKNKVTRPYYDGLIFHRVIKNFMIQGGCILGTGAGTPGYTFKDEINAQALGLDTELALEKQPEGFAFNPKLQSMHPQMVERYIITGIAQRLNIMTEEQFKARQDEFLLALETLTMKEFYEFLGYKYSTTLKSHEPKRGVIAMANRGANTNGAQFFINLVDTPWLVGKHTVFGKVIAGMNVVDKIGEVEVEEESSRPLKEVKIIRIRTVSQ